MLATFTIECPNAKLINHRAPCSHVWTPKVPEIATTKNHLKLTVSKIFWTLLHRINIVSVTYTILCPIARLIIFRVSGVVSKVKSGFQIPQKYV